MKRVELPLVEPIYSTYHHQGAGAAAMVNNPSIRNWYLNEVMELVCNRKFLSGYTTPEINIINSSWINNPYYYQRWFTMEFLNGHIHTVIRNMLDAGYYVVFHGIDDYYVKGKTWYHKKHFEHDGLLCGYDREKDTYCMYAYDSNWIYQKFWTPRRAFDAGRCAMMKKGLCGYICGIQAKPDQITFSPAAVRNGIERYLDSTMEKYPENETGDVRGIIVQDYIGKYLERLIAGLVPYERMDRRVFRVIWEHKKVMGERIARLEQELSLGPVYSERYAPLIAQADTMRMLYASHHMKRRDSVLPMIQKLLLDVKRQEKEILTELMEKTEGKT